MHRLVWATVLLLLLGAVADASSLENIRARGTLRIGTTGDYAPFTLQGRDGSLSGFDIAQGRALAGYLHVQPEFVLTSWATMASDFVADKFDIAMGGVSITPARAAAGAFSEPYLHDGKTPIARCADVDRFATIEAIDRPDTRVVVNPGGTNERFVRAHLPKAQVRVVPDNRLVFDEIADGRADVMITDAIEARLQAKKHPGMLCAVHPEAPFEPADKAYWFGKDEAFKVAVDAWLAQAKADGSLASRAREWLP